MAQIGNAAAIIDVAIRITFTTPRLEHVDFMLQVGSGEEYKYSGEQRGKRSKWPFTDILLLAATFLCTPSHGVWNIERLLSYNLDMSGASGDPCGIRVTRGTPEFVPMQNKLPLAAIFLTETDRCRELQAKVMEFLVDVRS
jgi:hypothetical protein